MKNLVLIVCLLVTVTSAFATEKPNKKKWKSSPIVTNYGKNGDIHSSMVMERYVGNGKKVFPVASISVTRSVNLAEKVDLDNLAKLISSSFKGATFESWKSKNAIYLKGDWSWANRVVYIKLISSGNNELTSFFSLTRPVFYTNLEKEIRTLDTVIEKNVLRDNLKGPRTSYLDVVFSRAHAQLTIDGLDEVGEEMGDLNDNIATMNENMGGLVEEIDEFNGTFSEFNDTATELSDTAAKIGDEFGKLNENITGINENWDTTNQYIDQILDTRFMAIHGAVVGAATAAGAALGGFVMNLAIDGVVTGVKALWTLISGQERREILWKDFQNAQENWEKERARALNLERKTDAYLMALARVEEKTPEQIVESVIEEQAALEVLVRNNEDQAEEARLSGKAACAAFYLKEKKLIERDIAKLGEFLNYLDDSSMERKADESFFCNQIHNLKKGLVDYQVQMNSYRLDILAGAKEWIKGFKSHLREMQKKQTRVNSEWYQDRVQELGNSLVGMLKRKALSEKRFDKRQFLSECNAVENEVGQYLKEKYKGDLFASIKRHKGCRDAWKMYLAEIYATDLQSIDQAVAEARDSVDNFHDFTAKETMVQDRLSQLKLVINMEEWFKNVGEEMLCMTHQNDPVKEAACMEKFPEAMGPARALKKLDEAYRQRGCFEIMQQASASIAGYSHIVEQMKQN